MSQVNIAKQYNQITKLSRDKIKQYTFIRWLT
jgi:hypothetical protein